MTPRPSEGSLVSANRGATQRLLVSSRCFPACFWHGHRRSSRCSVGRSSLQVASSALAAETPPPRFDGSSKQGAGVIGCGQLLVAVAGARRSPCAARRGEIRAATFVAVVVFVVLGGAVAGGGVARGAGGLVCLLVGARQRTCLPLVGSRQRPPTARRRAGSVPPRARPRRAERGSLRGGSGGSFFTSSPRPFLASVEGPAPLRRTFTTSLGFAPARASSRPFLTVLIAMPVARATAATPPQPSACASLPAHSLRPRSSSVGFNIRHFSRTNFSRSVRRATTNVDHIREIVSIPGAPNRTMFDRLFHSRPLTHWYLNPTESQ